MGIQHLHREAAFVVALAQGHHRRGQHLAGAAGFDIDLYRHLRQQLAGLVVHLKQDVVEDRIAGALGHRLNHPHLAVVTLGLAGQRHKAGFLADLDLGDVGLRHTRPNRHHIQIGQGHHHRGDLHRDHGLALLHRQIDHRAVNRRGDGGVAQRQAAFFQLGLQALQAGALAAQIGLQLGQIGFGAFRLGGRRGIAGQQTALALGLAAGNLQVRLAHLDQGDLLRHRGLGLGQIAAGQLGVQADQQITFFDLLTELHMQLPHLAAHLRAHIHLQARLQHAGGLHGLADVGQGDFAGRRRRRRRWWCQGFVGAVSTTQQDQNGGTHAPGFQPVPSAWLVFVLHSHAFYCVQLG